VSEPSLSDLDRCEHGRHAVDTCVSCPGGWSLGNRCLEPGMRIGTTLYGQPIVVRDVWGPLTREQAYGRDRIYEVVDDV
jgi:hypothetical protein